MNKCLAEMIGTFALVFAGTGAIVIDQVSGGAVTHVGVGLTFGLVVMAMIYAVGDVSGAHLNPAVTLGFFAARRFPGREIFPYVASQCAGALLASSLLRFLFPRNETLGGTFPAGSVAQSFVLEIGAHLYSHVRDSLGLDRGEGTRDHRRHRRRWSDRIGSAFCRADLWRVDESGAVVRPGARFRATRFALDLPGCTGRGRLSRSHHLSCGERRRAWPRSHVDSSFQNRNQLTYDKIESALHLCP